MLRITQITQAIIFFGIILVIVGVVLLWKGNSKNCITDINKININSSSNNNNRVKKMFNSDSIKKNITDSEYKKLLKILKDN